MTFQHNAFSIVLLMSGIVILLMSSLIFRQMTKAARWFTAVMFCITMWAISYSFELASNTLDQMLFWIGLEYIGISFLPAAWINFVLRYTGDLKWINTRNQLIILLFPTLTLLLVWTNSWHHLHYEAASLDASGPFPLLNIKTGAWYYVHTAYFYFMLAWGTYLLIMKFRSSDVVYKRQNVVILVSAFIPWGVNFLYLSGVRPHGHIDLTPYGFIFTAFGIGFGLLRLNLFNVVPLAREKIIEEIREGILVLDINQRVIDLNALMKKFLSDDSTAIIGKPFLSLFLSEPELQRLVGDRLDGKTEIRLHHDKQEYFFEVAVTQLFGRKSAPIGTALIFWDVTERKLSEVKLKEQSDELRALNQLKDRMFSIVAHDLRSPLVNLMDILAMAEQGLTESEFNAFLPMLSKNVGSTSLLVENLLHWSKSQLKGEMIKRETFKLKDLIKDIIQLFEKRIVEKKLLVKDDVGAYTTLYADKDMIRLVLRNLIANAIKFCKTGDTITISAIPNGHTTTVCIGDTGVGMDEETYQRLFGMEIFSKPGTLKEKGTGLGLILCKDFIEKNDGKIWAESKPDEGSKFYFELGNAK